MFPQCELPGGPEAQTVDSGCMDTNSKPADSEKTVYYEDLKQQPAFYAQVTLQEPRLS